MDTTNTDTYYRFITKWDRKSAPVVGETLANSYEWDGDQMTGDELPGTCAFETARQVEEYAQHSRGCGWIVEIEGNHKGYGYDFAGEVIIADAVIVSVRAW